MTSVPDATVTAGGQRDQSPAAPGGLRRRFAGDPGATGEQRLAGLLRQLCGRVWLWPALLTLALTLYHSGVPVMWQDELATISVITRPTGAIWAMLHNVDAVHGAYYLSLHFWIKVFGDSPVSIRFPSALAMTVAAVCTALIGRRLFGFRAGVAAGLVFALLPTVARYGQETRSYALVVMTAALSLLMLLRALERPGPGRWALYTAVLALAGYFNLVSLAFLCGHALMVLLEYRRTRAKSLPACFTAAVLIAVVVLYPVIHYGSAQSTRQIGWIPRPTVPGLASIWPQILGSTSLAVVLLLFALLAWRRPERRAVLLVTALVLLPWLVIWTVSHGHVSYYLSKYLFFVLPAAAVLAGAGLATLRLRYLVPVMVALAAVVVPAQRAMHAPLSHANYLYPDALWFTPRDYRAAADLVAAGYRPGDGIVYGQGNSIWWETSVGVPYYLPKDKQPQELFVGRTAEQRNDLWFTFCADPAACLGDHPRLWLVAVDHPGNAFASVPAKQSAALREHYTVVERRTVSGLTVFLLDRKA
ncbi:hypothetical protein GXW82_37460 [Streptacidiphilus sp. 4-A2]|nr:hypothetical protein [Streptacidiphilus sp. 4-A2]